MAKLITVCGATGGVGGSVARKMLKEGWSVRAVTRSTGSSASKALREAGAELVSANYDDVDSLKQAFQGSDAIFGITNIFQYLLETTPEDAAAKERQQIINIASAADAIPTLEHLVLHTLPAGEKLAGKAGFVPHMDGKDQAADIIKTKMPSIAQKTTFMWIGFFSSNFHSIPMMKPLEIPGTQGSHVYIQPTPPSLQLYCAGDVDHNAGVFVNAILANPSVTLPAKYAFLYTSQGTMQEYLQAWIDVTGRRATFVSTSLERYEQIWGPFGKELGLMLKAFEAQSDWTAPYQSNVITARDLGLKDEDLCDLRAALEKNKELL